MFLSIKEAANLYGVADQTVYSWLRKKLITGVRTTPGQNIKIDTKAISCFMELRQSKVVLDPGLFTIEPTTEKRGIDYSHRYFNGRNVTGAHPWRKPLIQ